MKKIISGKRIEFCVCTKNLIKLKIFHTVINIDDSPQHLDLSISVCTFTFRVIFNNSRLGMTNFSYILRRHARTLYWKSNLCSSPFSTMSNITLFDWNLWIFLYFWRIDICNELHLICLPILSDRQYYISQSFQFGIV